MKICSLLPSATEILFALGVGDQVVGVSHECDFPPMAAAKPVVLRSLIDSSRLSSEAIDRAVRDSLANHTSLYQLQTELVAQLQPDLVVTQELCTVCAIGASEVVTQLAALPHQPRIVSLHPHTIQEIFQDILLLGRETDRLAQAHQVIQALRDRLDRVQARVASATTRPRVCCVEWLDPLMASGHWVPEQVELAGGLEVLGQKGQLSRDVSWEELLNATPEMLIVMPCGLSLERTRRELAVLAQRPDWQMVPAVANGQVYLVDGPAYYNRSGPRVVDGVELLAALLHPEQMPRKLPFGAVERLVKP